MQVFKLAFVLSVCWHTSTATECCNLQCQCDNHVINCDSRDLTDIPTCESTYNSDFQNMTIRNNNLTNPTLSKVPGSVIKLDLSDNLIDTFNIPEDNTLIKVLNLRGNKLTAVPDMTHFDNLEDLDVSQNPISSITGFPDSIMRQLGSKLKAIHVGDRQQFITFPRSISYHLQKLDTLEINGASPAFQYITPDAFHSFRARLQNLTIRNTFLQVIPLQLSTLTHLEELHFDDNPVGDYGIIPQAFTGLSNLEKLTLRNDRLSSFPAIVETLKHLKSFALDGNNLLYIREDALDMVNRSNIVDLSLQNCSLDRVPGAVANHLDNYLQNMRNLNFANNNIHSIERHDLKNLQSLKTVSFAGNPVGYISSEAFCRTPSLTTLDLSGTQLTNIPEAIKNVESLRHIIITDTEVECTCELASIRKILHINNIEFTGECKTINSNVENYLNVFVPKCPLYNFVTPPTPSTCS